MTHFLKNNWLTIMIILYCLFAENGIAAASWFMVLIANLDKVQLGRVIKDQQSTIEDLYKENHKIHCKLEEETVTHILREQRLQKELEKDLKFHYN